MDYSALKKEWDGGNLVAYYLVKEVVWKSYKKKKRKRKSYILYDSNYVTSWKRQNYGDSKGSVAAGVRDERVEQSAKDFEGSETTLSDIIMVDTCHYTFVKTHICQNPLNVKHQHQSEP